LRAEHHAVDNEGILFAEQLREADHAITAFERIVFGDLSAARKSAAERSHALDVPSELDLFREESVAGLAIFGALAGEVRLVLRGKLCRRDEVGVVGHSILLDEDVTCQHPF
jgi:hypothetical protein